MQTVKFTRLDKACREELEFLDQCEVAYASKVAARLISTLEELEGAMSGFQVSRLEHSLQSATRAWFDGADDDWVVSTLLHDIGDVHAPYNHDEYAALVLKPFVREQCSWTVQVHGDFQKYYYAGQLGQDPNVRDAYRDNPYFDDCVAFCERWDQISFDPAYNSLPLQFFRPLVEEVFSRRPYDTAVNRPGERVLPVNADVARERANAPLATQH